METKVSFYLIDTFTSVSAKGSPTAVYLLRQPVAKEWMQQAAKTANVPVTAFVELDGNNAHHPIFYYTPVTEIHACGHATLAAARAMCMQGSLQQFQFITVERKLVDAMVKNDFVTIGYPKYSTAYSIVKKELFQSLGLQQWMSIGVCNELETLFLEITEEELYRVKPDFKALQQSSNELKEVVITARSNDERYDYLLRSFCPWIGIDEDPVTGSVHSVLAGYWATQLHKSVLKVYQASAAGGELFVKNGNDKVELSGNTIVKTAAYNQYN